MTEENTLLALDAARILLESRGLRCVSVPDGPAAASLLARSPGRFAAAVVDLPLSPAVPGQEVVRRLRALRPDLPVVVTSAFSPQAPEANLRGLGGPTARVLKPYWEVDLLAALDDVLAPEAQRRRRCLRRRRSDQASSARPSALERRAAGSA